MMLFTLLVPDQAYTTDEGTTLITLSKDEIPPVTLPDGKIALRVHVFGCDGGKTRQVLWLKKYSSAAMAGRQLNDDATGSGSLPPCGRAPSFLRPLAERKSGQRGPLD